jgi:hypothetical protein
MEKMHFDDLTKITAPFGLLDDDTQDRLMAHGGPFEFFAGYDWRTVEPTWIVDVTYRAAPKDLTKPDVPWDMLADWVNYVARDMDGEIYGYEEKPEIPSRKHWWAETHAGKSVEFGRILKIDPGTCDWKDSLVTRPWVSE